MIAHSRVTMQINRSIVWWKAEALNVSRANLRVNIPSHNFFRKENGCLTSRTPLKFQPHLFSFLRVSIYSTFPQQVVSAYSHVTFLFRFNNTTFHSQTVRWACPLLSTRMCEKNAAPKVALGSIITASRLTSCAPVLCCAKCTDLTSRRCG